MIQATVAGRCSVVLAIATFALAGCVTGDVSQFSPKATQEAVVRDGVPALVSHQPNSIVLVRQAQRERPMGSRPAYVIAILNTSTVPINFTFSELAVGHVRDGQVVMKLKTYSYEELVREERTAQVMGAILVGLAAGANAAAASNAGTYSASGTVYSPYGTSRVNIVGYDPTAAQIAQMNANMQNQAMISRAVETGRNNLDALEQTIIKDSTIFPGEWYGGQVQFQQPQGTPPISFKILVDVGEDLHEIDVTQVKPAA